jgi:hypothetical protein
MTLKGIYRGVQHALKFPKYKRSSRSLAKTGWAASKGGGVVYLLKKHVKTDENATFAGAKVFCFQLCFCMIPWVVLGPFLVSF